VAVRDGYDASSNKGACGRGLTRSASRARCDTASRPRCPGRMSDDVPALARRRSIPRQALRMERRPVGTTQDLD